jgi:hypothetical protein
MRREVALEGAVAIRATADEVAVDPNLRVLVDAVELDGDTTAFEIRIEREVLAIPTDAARGVARAAGVLRPEGAFDAPVVRELDGAPRGVVEGGAAGCVLIAEGEPPIGVEQGAFARSGVLRRQGESREQDGGRDAARVTLQRVASHRRLTPTSGDELRKSREHAAGGAGRVAIERSLSRGRGLAQ